MRILIVVNSLRMGGMERVACTLADAFASSGHESHLLYFKDRAAEVLPENPTVHLHHYNQRRAVQKTGFGLILDLLSRIILNPLLRNSHFIWTGWLSGLLFRRAIRRIETQHGKFDLIIFRGIDTFKHVWSFRDARAVYVLENIVRVSGPSWLKRYKARLLLDNRNLVCVSKGVLDSTNEAATTLSFAPKSIRVITNPCPVHRIQKKMHENDSDIPTQPYILNVARLVPQKGHHLLLEAYAEAKPDELLVIVGDGPEKASLEHLARELRIDNKVLFVGQRANPYPWMRNARLFVLSSKYEGLGIVLFEALACGTPVVSVDCPGGVRDIFKGSLEDNLAPLSSQGLASKLREVLSHTRQEIDPTWLLPFQPSTIVNNFIDSFVALNAKIARSQQDS